MHVERHEDHKLLRYTREMRETDYAKMLNDKKRYRKETVSVEHFLILERNGVSGAQHSAIGFLLLHRAYVHPLTGMLSTVYVSRWTLVAGHQPITVV